VETAEAKEKEWKKAAKEPKESPERKAARQVEKENSPVREFLNQDDSEEEQEAMLGPPSARQGAADGQEAFRMDRVACRAERGDDEEEVVSALSE
jgi:hypothetical protein